MKTIFYKGIVFFLSFINILNIYASKVTLNKTDTTISCDLWVAYTDVQSKKLWNKDSLMLVFEHVNDASNSFEYAFKIDGIDNDWSKWSHLHYKKYLLLPGDYTVHVKIRNTYDMSESQAGIFSVHVGSKNTLKIIIGSAFILLGLFIIICLMRQRKQKRKIQIDSENKYQIQKFDLVTVLFADIEGFSKITDQMNPDELMQDLNQFFLYFDTIVDRYNIEKIKTMGDAYMCAGGIPQPNKTNPVDIVLAALEVQEYLKVKRAQKPDIWSVRIGIHTGQVIAGMLGSKKVSYDIWGHTVNVASRLESACKAGKINISGTTYELVKEFFDCEYYGKLPDGNGNESLMYYVNGCKPEYKNYNKIYEKIAKS